MPENVGMAGEAILRNPGVTMLWTTRSYSPFSDGRGGVLFEMGDPIEVQWLREGREATRAEVDYSIETGLPALRALAEKEPGAVDELEQCIARLSPSLPP